MSALLYAINSQAMLASAERFDAALQAALAGGIDWFQLRDKREDARARMDTAVQALRLCRAAQVPLIINDDLQLARAIGAHGLHLGGSDGSIAEARKLLGRQAIIGASCHSDLQRAQQAVDEGASYVAFGRFFASRSKPEAPPADIEWLAQHAKEVSAPICAIGGISIDRLAPVLDAGARIVAVIDAIFGAPDPCAAAQALRQAINSHPPDNQVTIKYP